jgi:hypothetical protein
MNAIASGRANRRTFILLRCLIVCGVVALEFAVRASATGDVAKEKSFKLREVSVFDAGQNDFLRGQLCRCQDKPFAEVKGYPAFTSKAPIFGSVRFGARRDDTNSGVAFFFAVDESRGTGKGYDRLYFDANRDLDLRNDAVGRPQPLAPDRGYEPHFAGVKEKVVFDFLKLDLSAGAASPGPVELMPRLLRTGDSQRTYSLMFFVRTRLFEGDIEIGGEKFKARLGNDYGITPGLDSPHAALLLSQGNNTFDWWGGDRLSAVHKVGGRFFTFTASPTGDQLTVRPYEGDLGTFEIGAGTRALTNLSVSGSLAAREWAVPVGGEIKDGRPLAAPRCQIPTGDYLPTYLTVGFGRLRIRVSQNYHSDGKRRDRGGRPAVYGIAVRKDKPFVLDFANKPDVMFVSPAKDQRVKAGDELKVMAVLVDPQLDLMIRGLDDTTRKQTKDAEGKSLGYERVWSLDPKVIIRRANGEKVAEGVMPFG